MMDSTIDIKIKADNKEVRAKSVTEIISLLSSLSSSQSCKTKKKITLEARKKSSISLQKTTNVTEDNRQKVYPQYQYPTLKVARADLSEEIQQAKRRKKLPER